jgi:hypothetical protein
MILENFRLRISAFYQNNLWLTIVEISIAVLMLIAHLLGYLPVSSTVYVLLYAWLSLWLRGKRWKNFGLQKPESWNKTILLAASVGIVYQALSLYIIEPFLSEISGELPDVTIFKPLVGNFGFLLFWIFISWTLAAFGEEMVYRGYFMHRLKDIFKNEKVGWMFGLIISSFLFGGIHLYQGASGMISVGLFGLSFGILYFASGKNLWAPILAHGISDSAGFVMIYFGIYPGI